MSSRIIGVDLVPIKAVRGAVTLTEDITAQQCRDRLRKESGGSLFDVVLNDGAPNVGGAFATEMYTQVRPPLHSSALPQLWRPGARSYLGALPKPRLRASLECTFCLHSSVGTPQPCGMRRNPVQREPGLRSILCSMRRVAACLRGSCDC